MVFGKAAPGLNNDYSRYIGKKWLALAMLAAALLGICLLSVSAGSAGLGLPEILRVLAGGGKAASRTIIWSVRLPRIATAIGVGIALSTAGCVMQNLLRNPMASASTLGVAQGASFGAAVAIVFFGAGVQVGTGAASAITFTNPYIVTVCAFIGGTAATAFMLLLSLRGGVNPPALVLAGVAVSALFTGATTLIQYFSDDVTVASVVHWTFGNLGRAGWKEIALIFSLDAAAFLYFVFNRWNYNAMGSGLYTARSLGVNAGPLLLAGMSVCTLVSAVSIAFVGTINFIGLIAPHIARRFVGNDYRFLLPCSALTGAAVMLAADLASRMAASPAVLPIGALTSFLGAPLFLYIIIQQGKKAQ